MANPQTPTRRRRSLKETHRLGEDIYQRTIREQVEADHVGEIVAIDVDSGAWAIADSVLAAADLLRQSNPDAVDVWGVRVGYKGLRSFGAGSLRIQE